MSKKKDYYVHSGWIAGGPSREAIFDSLRWGKIVQFEFIRTDREVVGRDALVVGLKRRDRARRGENDEWVIELIFAGKYFPKDSGKHLNFSWSGSYSTRSREGELTCDVPKCLIVN